MNHELVKKILYFFLAMIVYVGIYFIGYGLITLVEKFVVIHPYILLCLYLVLFLIDIFLTTKLISMHKILNWLNQF